MSRYFSHSPWPLTLVLIFSLLVGSILLVQDRWHNDMADAQASTTIELNLLGTLVKNDLRQGDYQHSDEVLQEWGTTHPDILHLKLITSNGFVISEYQHHDRKTIEHRIRQELPIDYSYTGTAQLSLEKDLVHIYEDTRLLVIQLGIALLVISAMLATVVRLLSLYREETLVLQQRTDELHRSNDALNREIEQRNLVEQDKARMLSILEATTDLVSMADPDGKLFYLNQAGRSMTGLGNQALGNMQLTDLHPAWAVALTINEGLPVAERTGSWSGETALLDSNGKEFPVSQVILSHKDDAGTLLFYSTIMRDITRIRAAEDALKHMNEQLEARVNERTAELMMAMEDAKRANNAKSDFLSSMSHELRTPMNAILGFAQVLELNTRKNLSADEMASVNEILKGGHHLLDLINEVLDLAQIESGKIKVSMENVDLDELVDDCVVLITPMANKRNITINTSEMDKKTMVYADRMRLKQVIVNLLSNAVKYNHIGGNVTLSCSSGENSYRFCVSDTGPGIPQSMHHRVFEPFDRLNANSSLVEGVGIGLSLVKRLVEFMGGTITFSSTEGEGSSFCVELAAGTEIPRVHDETIPAELQMSLSDQHKVLYVEDNPANLRLVTRLLKELGGIQLHDAHTATLALEMAQNTHFDLILLDIHLAGEEDGYYVLDKLRNNPATRSIPIFAISANATARDVERGLAAGFDEYLIKPIDINHFSHTVVKWINKGAEPA